MKRAFALTFPLALAACGGGGHGSLPPSTVNPGSSLSFSPSQVTAQRFAGTCLTNGVPPYSDADVFSLNAVGAQNPVPRTLISVSIKPAVAVGTSYALVLSAPTTETTSAGSSRQEVASSADGVVQLAFAWGADASEIDSNDLDAATVTVDAFPAQDGDALTVHCVLHFTDAQTLDITFSADTVGPSSGCPAG